MNDKDMLNDYLAMIKSSLATYANVIALYDRRQTGRRKKVIDGL